MPLDDAETRTRADARPGEPRRTPPEHEDDRHEKPDGDDGHEGKSSDQESKGDKPDPQKEQQDRETQRRRRRWVIPLVAGLVILAIAGGVWYWLSTRNLQSTDDAFTDGRAVTIAPKVSGYVVALNVNDNQFVHRGDVLLRIDDRDYVASRDQARGQVIAAQGQAAAAKQGFAIAKVNFPARLASAQAQVQSAQAAYDNAAADLRRQLAVGRAATTQQAVDQARANEQQTHAALLQAQAAEKEAEPVPENIAQSGAQVDQLSGSLVQAQAQLAQAELNVGYTVITAPSDGWITKRNVERGQYVQPGASLFSLVEPQVWVTANFKETELDRMRPGQHVRIAVDAYPHLKLHGHVDSVQLGSGSKFSAFPAENATGNYVKIVQRVPVKIDIDDGLDPNLPLPLGVSVVPTVELK